MKMTTLFLFFALLQVAARTSAQVTIKERSASLVKVLVKLKEQSGYGFIYDGALLRTKAKPVSVDVNNVPIERALEEIFQTQDQLSYVINGKVITVKEKTEKKSESLTGDLSPRLETPLPPPTKDISGKVTDAEGNPLAGASIKVRGGTLGTSTNAEGIFILKGVDEKAVIEIGFVGYETMTMAVGTRTSFIVSLKVKEGMLQEVIVNKGYYTEKQKYSVSNVGRVTGKDIEKQPVNNPLLALQGRVPGLIVTQASGLPGSGVTVRIQGQNSLRAGNDPLYVIDGVPYVSQMLVGLSDVQGRSGGANGGGSGNPMSYINPLDIESIEVLKDADATSIYGSRAANGAILITTKKGKAGQTRIDLNMQSGWGKVGHFMDLLNTQQYLEMRMEAKKNDNATINATDYDINGVWNKDRNTDWQKELIGGTSNYNNVQLSVSGGSGNTNFLVSGNYRKETTVFPGTLGDNSKSFHVNLNHSSSNQRLKLQFDAKYLSDDNRLSIIDLTSTAVIMPSNAPAIYNSDGSLNWAPDQNGISTWRNPLTYLYNTYDTKVNNLVSNVSISYEIIPGLNVKSSFGYTHLTRDEIVLIPLTVNAPELRPTSTRFSNFGNDVIKSWIAEPQLTYKRNIGKGILEILVGSTFHENNVEQKQIQASGFSSDQLMRNILSATTLVASTTDARDYKYNALFSRINYNWKNKYLLNISARRDGSSRFGPENLFHNFASVGSAWIFSEEKIVKNNLPFLSFGKIRLSYGTSGNDQIGDYLYLNLYSSRNRTVPYQGSTGLTTSRIPDPFLQWEDTRKLQLGLDMGFLKDQVVLSSTYFRNRSSNQLQSYALPLFISPTSFTTNFPATIQNSGWEFLLTLTNNKSKKFAWTSSLNLTVPSNKLISYKNLDKSTVSNTYIIGEPFTIGKAYQYLGVDPQTGLFTFQSKQGTPINNPTSPVDAFVVYNRSPKYYGGFQNSFSFHGFSVDFLIQFARKFASDYRFGNQPGFFRSANNRNAIGNQPTSVLDRWKNPNDKALFQRYSASYPSLVSTPYSSIFLSDANIVDASFIRLKNVSVSWQLPESWQKKLQLKNARIYVQGQNLLTWTNGYVGYDPDSGNIGANLPPLRIWTMGVQLSF